MLKGSRSNRNGTSHNNRTCPEDTRSRYPRWRGDNWCRFLEIEGGSRPAGLGGAFAGLANDINTIFWNPAGLTAVHDRELTAMQHFSFADINNQTIGYAQRIERLVWGASFLGSFTEIERRQGPTEDPDSTVTVGGFATGLSLAYPLGEAISVGGTAKIISEQLDIQNAFGVAADVGLVARLLDNRLGIGVAVQNAGVLDGGENLPMALRAGLAYRTWKQPAAEAETDKTDAYTRTMGIRRRRTPPAS